MGSVFNRGNIRIKITRGNPLQMYWKDIKDFGRFFENIPKIYRKIKNHSDVGLGDIFLGQQSTTLSGGSGPTDKNFSGQKLSKRDTETPFIYWTKPTTAFHFEDIRVLIERYLTK